MTRFFCDIGRIERADGRSQLVHLVIDRQSETIVSVHRWAQDAQRKAETLERLATHAP